ncbi:KICSTOR complex protein ITFG2-like isoform X2 [Lycorma delicatula]|uniref:KICSTOR complex protein ITFG2-like isoform X2 n=1 Tax=Lycorma delicatula TaxID=130591 RepID=UPI003F51157B
MRAVRFVERLEFDFTGNIFGNAIKLGDVDNDGQPELIVGNSVGDLAVFKGEVCWQKITGLGMITAVGVGDVMNCGSNALVVICGDGWCHIFLCLQSKTEESENSVPQAQGKLQPVHVQRIPANTKILLVGDIDDDGNEELVMGLSDRVVRSYRWSQSVTGGKLVCLNKWECARQIGSVTLNRGPNGIPCLLVAQPGGTFMRIRTEAQNVDKNSKSIQMDHQLFALSKLDLTGEGLDQIVACSWDGQTYILDQKKHCVRFQLEESVAVFCAGLYSFMPSNPPVPCLIYTTFTNKIYIYYNIKLPSLASKSLITHVLEEGELETLYGKELIFDREKLKKLIEWCLYNKHNGFTY